tara:strand:+ start:1677 stop:2321 length:645 start_codon:yes stop_codon:yes gene_type:complete
MRNTLFVIFFLFPALILSQCIEGDCIDGYGKILYENNNSYEGYFKNGLKNGQGTLIEFEELQNVDGSIDKYRTTTKGLFVGDKIMQGEKVMKNLKVPLEAFVTIKSFSRFGEKDAQPEEENLTNAEKIFDVVGETDDFSTSEITIYNTYNGPFIMKLDSNSYEFKANETKTISIKSGTYNLQAFNKCCAPYSIKITLEGGKKYFKEYFVYTVSK